MTEALEIAPMRFEADGVQSFYDPCLTGVHVCGSTPCDQPYTGLNIPADHARAARAKFEALKSEASCSEDEADFVVDLNIDGDCDEDFWSNRQLLQAALRRMSAPDGAERTE